MQSFSIDGIVVMPPLVAEYKLDPTIVTNKENLSFEQGYNFEYHNFLYNTRDTSINKSSTFILTDTTNVIDYFDIKPIPFQYPVNITTYLAYNTVDTDPFTGLTAVTGSCLTSVSAASALSALSANNNLKATYITISDSITLDSDNSEVKTISAEKFTSRRTDPNLPQKYYFNIMIIDAVNCYVYHLEGEDRWYLSHKDDVNETLKFVKVNHIQGFEDLLDQIELDGGDKIKFQYNLLPDGRIRLYKQFDGKTQVVKMLSPDELKLQPNTIPVRLEPTLDPDQDLNLETNNPNISELTDFTTIKIRPPYKRQTYKNLQPNVNNYTTDISNNSLHISNHSYEHKVNMLVHSEYYYLTGESIPINFFSLKNDQTPSGTTSNNVLDKREHNLYSNRFYNKIETGTNQIDGKTNISLEYSTSTHTYEFHPGMNYFNTPQDIEPFKKININDTNLARSGSIAGANPAQSDKIFKHNRGNDKYLTTTSWGNSEEEQLGTWLCTWLSGGNDPQEKPIWVDRYYNPTKSGYVSALTEVTEYVHNRYESETFDVFEGNEGNVIDVSSKMTLEPGMKYAYHRLNSIDIQNNLSVLEPFKLTDSVKNFKTISNKPGAQIDGIYQLDGKHIGEISTTSNSSSLEQFSISFDINLKNFKTVHNHQIIGNYTSQGLGFFQKNDVSPFMFLLGSDGTAVNNQLQNTSIRIYNNRFELYNYITNDSFLTDSQSPSLFHSLVIREIPENIYAITTTGDILELTHDGIILSNFTQWTDQFVIPYEQQHNITPELKSVTWDERYIYILSHTGTRRFDYKIHQFDTISKEITELDDRCKTFLIDPPDELAAESTVRNYGKHTPRDNPPNQISISDGRQDYSELRTLYLSNGDICKSGKRYIWNLIVGAKDPVTDLQVNHDLLYCFDKYTLKTITGLITDNNLADKSNPLSITDYALDADEKIWVIHGEDKLSIFSKDRKLVKTTILEEQQGVSLVVTRDYESNGINEVVDKVCILGNTAGTETLTLQIGPVAHPTNNPTSTDWRKASPWIINGNVYDRNRFIDESSIIYDDLSTYDESTQVLYPFVDGASRFGIQSDEISEIPGDDVAGRVLDGDYELITDGFDFIVNEDVNVLKGNIFDAKTCKLIEVQEITDLSINDLQNLPQLINHFEYSVLNFQRYPENNLNFKLNLEPLYKKASPDKVNLKLNLDEITGHPFTGFFNITVNINNTSGRVEMWVNGQLKQEHIYEFDKHKYRFTSILNKKLIIGATPFLNDTLLFNKLNTTVKYIVNDVDIKNINIYTKCLDFHDILNNMRKDQTPESMTWDIPCRDKNYIETIERMFNHSIPPRKSNSFDMVIRNSNIRSLNLQNYISNKVKQSLQKITPAGTLLRSIAWSNELLDFDSLETDNIDYNPVADEIIVDPSGVTLPTYLPYILQ